MANTGESKLFAFLAYLLGIIGFLIVLLLKKNDKFAMYHAKQSLVLFIASVIVGIVGGFVPVIGWFVILPVGYLLVFILAIIGIINALTGKEKALPLIGKYAAKFDF
ncbi:MAG: DUF4870 domain-containing protein [Nanoarchaeota archaeon]